MIADSPDAPARGTSIRDCVLRFTAIEQRSMLSAVLAIEQEVGKSLDPSLEHDVSHIRLAWWQEELQRTAQGAPRHPATRQLVAQCLVSGRTPPDLQRLIESVRVDLARVAFTTRLEFAEYLSHWSLSIFRQVALQATTDLTARSAAERFASTCGVLIREIELIAMLASSALQGRIYVVLDDPAADYNLWCQQPWLNTQAQSLQARLLALRLRLREVTAATPAAVRSPLRSAFIWASLADQQAARAINCLPQQHTLRRRDALSRTWIAWRAALAADRGESIF